MATIGNIEKRRRKDNGEKEGRKEKTHSRHSSYILCYSQRYLALNDVAAWLFHEIGAYIWPIWSVSSGDGIARKKSRKNPPIFLCPFFMHVFAHWEQLFSRPEGDFRRHDIYCHEYDIEYISSSNEYYFQNVYNLRNMMIGVIPKQLKL